MFVALQTQKGFKVKVAVGILTLLLLGGCDTARPDAETSQREWCKFSGGGGFFKVDKVVTAISPCTRLQGASK